MARKKLITRDVAITKGIVMTVNLITKEVEETDFKIVGSYVNKEKIIQIHIQYDGIWRITLECGILKHN